MSPQPQVQPSLESQYVAQQPMKMTSMRLEDVGRAGKQEEEVQRLRGGCPGHLCGLPILPCHCDICIIPIPCC